MSRNVCKLAIDASPCDPATPLLASVVVIDSATEDESMSGSVRKGDVRVGQPVSAIAHGGWFGTELATSCKTGVS